MSYTFHIISLSSLGKGLSGGDRIYIEFARRWSKENLVHLYVWEEGLKMVNVQNLSGKFLKINLVKVGDISRLGFIITYFYRIILGIKLGLTLKMKDKDYIYSSSEFWMDFLPAFILKLRYPKTSWVAAWYQTAPKPWVGFAEGERNKKYRFRSFLYWIAQLPVKPLINRFVDFVLVNNDMEKKQFTRLNKRGRVVVVLGAVDIKQIGNWKLEIGNLPKVYDAVFQGRFHPQKGVLELIEIWDKVIKKIPKATLAMIGDGPLMQKVKEKIIEYKLQKNIRVFGYVFDGSKKYKIFSQSKIVVHPAFYDSGGMAAAEAMAFGLPCVGFKLKSFESYYPRGMVKVSIGDLEEFAKKIVELLLSEKLRESIGEEGLITIKSNCSWDQRAREIFEKITSI